MPLRMLPIAGVGLSLLLGACSTPETAVTASTPDVPTLATPAVRAAPAPPDGEPFSIGSAAVDTIGGFIPDNTMISPFDTVNPIVAWLDPALLSAVQEAAHAASADGVDVKLTSGWRTKGFQQRLFDQAVRMYGSRDIAAQFVASPDKSMHVHGRAVDVGPPDADQWLIRNGSHFGLCQIYANEIWHFELATSPDGLCPPLRVNAAG